MQESLTEVRAAQRRRVLLPCNYYFPSHFWNRGEKSVFCTVHGPRTHYLMRFLPNCVGYVELLEILCHIMGGLAECQAIACVLPRVDGEGKKQAGGYLVLSLEKIEWFRRKNPHCIVLSKDKSIKPYGGFITVVTYENLSFYVRILVIHENRADLVLSGTIWI